MNKNEKSCKVNLRDEEIFMYNYFQGEEIMSNEHVSLKD